MTKTERDMRDMISAKHIRFPNTRSTSFVIAVKLLGWKIGIGFWSGPPRHFLIRNWRWQWPGNRRGIEIDFSRLTVATEKVKP